MLMLLRLAVIAFLLVVVDIHGPCAALRFVRNKPEHFDFADQRVLPPTFGMGEFTLEIWIKPDASYPVGRTDRSSINQLQNWSEADPRPYGTPDWWFVGNFLLDGHTRPDGFTPDKTREGTFSLQFYGGGRLRWMFADDADVVPVGKVWSVQAYPAASTPSLLDNKWHNINCVRRWIKDSKSQLELWIDGKLIASQVIPMRINMRQFWDALPHPRNPKTVGGWCWGSEVMTACEYYFTQYEDYKGLLADVRLWDRAKSEAEIQRNWAKPITGSEPGLVGYFPLTENTGTVARDRIDPARTIILHNSQSESWADQNPFAPPAAK